MGLRQLCCQHDVLVITQCMLQEQLLLHSHLQALAPCRTRAFEHRETSASDAPGPASAITQLPSRTCTTLSNARARTQLASRPKHACAVTGRPFKAGRKASAAAAALDSEAPLAQIKHQERAASTAEGESGRDLRSSAEKRRRLASPADAANNN